MSLSSNILRVQVGTVYVLSSDDVERIDSMIQLVSTGFQELLASRKVEFPNSYYAEECRSEERLYEKKNQISTELMKNQSF